MMQSQNSNFFSIVSLYENNPFASYFNQQMKRENSISMNAIKWINKPYISWDLLTMFNSHYGTRQLQTTQQITYKCQN